MSFEIRPFASGDHDAVIGVWRRSGLLHPNNDPAKDIRRKLKVRPDLFMIGYDGHRGWVNYLGVLPEHQRRGYGRRLMEEAERLLRIEGCPKINLQVRTANKAALSFYDRIGFSDNDTVSLGKRLEQDS